MFSLGLFMTTMTKLPSQEHRTITLTPTGGNLIDIELVHIDPNIAPLIERHGLQSTKEMREGVECFIHKGQIERQQISGTWFNRLQAAYEQQKTEDAKKDLQVWNGRNALTVSLPPNENIEQVLDSWNKKEPLTLNSGHLKLAASQVPVDFDKSLLIKHLSVVEDPERTWDPAKPEGMSNPDGVWSFGHAWRSMFPPGTNKKVIREALTDWIESWNKANVIRTHEFPDGSHVEVETPKRGGRYNSFHEMWEKDNEDYLPEKSPFRLLAISLRPDLIDFQNHGWGEAGGTHLVFGARDTDLDGAGPMTVIFEYSMHYVEDAESFPLNAETAGPAIVAWFKEWASLAALWDTPSYSPKLEELVRQVTNPLSTDRIRGKLKQVRTNDAIPNPWEFREFVFDLPTLRLVPHPVTNTPDSKRHGQATKLMAYLRSIGDEVKQPDWLMADQFRGATSNISMVQWWNPFAAGHLEPDARRAFSRHTCNGCHGRETMLHNQMPAIDRFWHIRPRSTGETSELSSIFSETGIPDPAAPDTSIAGNEKIRRIEKMQEILSTEESPLLFALLECRPVRVH